MPLTGKQFVDRAIANGWRLDRVEGSHHILVKDGKAISVPVHSGKDLPTGLYHKLAKVAGSENEPQFPATHRREKSP
ncbi:MAG: type II toxin-antitoxin system HicA family toxin [Clostridiales bacterium]|nr:type II toxin-antitoxin system HicA family toxin [Clostridiales bacterium]